MLAQGYADILEGLYEKFNRRRYVHPDPLEFLYNYDDPSDRELVALVASSLAYGRVAQILKSVSAVLAKLGPEPVKHLAEMTPSQLRRAMNGFRHRFNTGLHVAAMLTGAKHTIERYGSLEACFAQGLSPEDETVLPALLEFVAQIKSSAAGQCEHLLPDPARGSACKRLNLMLRWLVRSDDVDPGGWSCVGREKLIVPLDTHMHRIALTLGMTDRKSADMRTALEVTEAFKLISPTDPVRYDFALTRFGIRDDLDSAVFLNTLSKEHDHDRETASV